MTFDFQAVQWSDPIVFTAITLTGGLLLLLVIRFLTGGLKDSPQAVMGDVSVALIVSVVLGPLAAHHFAVQREVEQRRWNARTAHLERFRPVLRADAAELTGMSRKVVETGHIFDAYAEFHEKDLEEVWHRHVLIRDLAPHFGDFFKAREDLRLQIIKQQTDIRDLTQRVASSKELSGLTERRKRDVSYSLVRQCIEKGEGIKLILQPNGDYTFWKWTYIAETGKGPPSQELVDAEKAFQQYRPNSNFKNVCQQTRARARELPDKLMKLSNEATSLAETSALPGDCPFIRID